MANVILNGEQVRVSETSKGTIYFKNYRSLTAELRAKGTDVTLNTEKHSFFINGNAYYVGPSFHEKGYSCHCLNPATSEHCAHWLPYPYSQPLRMVHHLLLCTSPV